MILELEMVFVMISQILKNATMMEEIAVILMQFILDPTVLTVNVWKG